MATFYLDPIGGNDSNDGTSFANRWKTWLSGATAARIAPGDTIRVIASPAPTSVGNATWTNGSRTVTLASAVTQTIENCDSGWTASTNVTATAASSGRKQGTNYASLSCASGFTTGKIAYKALAAPLDLSAYQQVSFWIRSSSATVAGLVELRLCSDTTGDTAVHTIAIDLLFAANTWRVAVKDFGSNLNSAIQSVALYATADPGATVFSLDNIIACKASSANDSLTHLSLIGKNTVGEPEWYPIMSIDGTTVELGSEVGASLTNSATLPRNYYGTTETVATYKLQPLDGVNGSSSPPFSSTARAVQDSGTDGNPITISGGWNRTDMSTQTGESWMTGSYWAGSVISFTGRSWITTERLGVAHVTLTAVESNSASAGLRLQFAGIAGCTTAFNSSFSNSIYVDFGNITGSGGPVSEAIQSTGVAGDATFVARRITGCVGSAIVLSPDEGRILRCYVSQIDSCGNYGIQNSSNNGKVVFHKPRLVSNGLADINGPGCGDLLLINALLESTTKIVQPTIGGDMLRFQNYDRSLSDHRVYRGGYNIATDASTRHTASGVSWKLSPISASFVNSQVPAFIPLGRRRVLSGVTTTFSCWVRRDSTSLTAGLRIIGGQVAGADATVSTAMTAAINTWEQISVQITPTEDGVVELEGWAYGGTTLNAWFDDVSVS